MVLDELRQETVQKKQLLERATSLLNCLESEQSYEWTNDPVSLCFVVMLVIGIQGNLLFRTLKKVGTPACLNTW